MKHFGLIRDRTDLRSSSETNCSIIPGSSKVVKNFRYYYGLQRHTLKNMDKFLWRVGAALLTDSETPA